MSDKPEERIVPGILLIREDSTCEEISSLQQVTSSDKAYTRLVLKSTAGEYIYPGSYEAIQKVVIKLEYGGRVDFQIFTDLGDMVAVVDPKRTSQAAMRLLRDHHEAQVKQRFLHHIFRDGYVILPETEILSVRTANNKVFTFWKGRCWEITPTNQLINVVRIPDQKIEEVYLGTFRLQHSEYSYVSHAAYSQDVSFEKENEIITPDDPGV